MAGSLLGSSLLGALTFCAKQHSAGDCDAKGLPLTPNTTQIIGKIERLKGLYHPNLAAYLEAQKLKSGEPQFWTNFYSGYLRYKPTSPSPM